MARDKVTEIKGIVRNTKDSAAEDGGCDEVLNLRFKDDSWRPVGTLKEVSGYSSLGSEGYERLYVHTNEYRHLFGVKGGNLYWIGNVSDESVVTPFTMGGTAGYQSPQLVKTGVTTGMRICQTGHLMVVIDGGLSYYLYRPYAERYDHVVTDFNNQIEHRLLPYGNVEFKVDLECCDDGRPFIFASHIESAGISDAWDNATKESEVMKDVIWKVQKDITALNRFWGAFLICTAAELYDGTFILMSQPSLMLAPNVKSSEHYQNWNTDILNSQPATPIDNGAAYEYDANKNVCEKVLSRYSSFYSSLNPETNTVAQDVRFGVSLLHAQLDKHCRGMSYVRVGLKRKNNNINFDYNKELITDTEFEALAIDIYKQTYRDVNKKDEDSISIGSDDIWDYVNSATIVNQKENVPFHSSGDVFGDRTYCCHFANKIKYKNTSIIPDEYKDVIKNISVFITPQAQMVDLDKYSLYSQYEEDTMPGHKYGGTDQRFIREFKYDYRTIANITKELMGEAMMYKIGEIKTEDFREANVGQWVDLPIEEGVLTNLLSQERLVTDSVGRDSYDAKVAFPYNNRLHIADYTEELFHGWLLDHFWYNEGVGQYAEGDYMARSMSGTESVGWIKVTIDENGTERTVVREILLPDAVQGGGSMYQTVVNAKRIRYLNPILSYPDKNAKTMEIYIHSDWYVQGANNTFHETYTLKAHDFMNYAYYVTPDLKPIDTGLTAYETSQQVQARPEEVNATEEYHNRMKVSKTNNAIYFPYENVYSVGNGKITGMAANELVLATGQVGDAPLYVFCSDGVYGFFVDSTGMLAYGFARVLSEYVCNNAAGIFNIHGGVMFPTDKGYVLLEGLQARDVTDKVEGVPFDVGTIKEMQAVASHDRLVRLYGRVTTEEFREFISGCIGSYNFADKEIWLTNKEKGYSYVIDRHGMFTKRTDVGVQFVNDFPRTYLLDLNVVGSSKVSTLGNLCEEERDAQQTMILTRAIKADTQEFKQTERLIVRGEFSLSVSPEHKVRRIDMRNVLPVRLTDVRVREPQNVVTVSQVSGAAMNEIVPGEVYRNWLAVYDEGSAKAAKDGGGNGLDLLNNDTLFAAVRGLFMQGYVFNPAVGWKSFTPTDANSVWYMITPDSDELCGYKVRMRFTDGVVYSFVAGQMVAYKMYFPGGWDGTCEELEAKLTSEDERGEFCYHKTISSTTEWWGLYHFTYNTQSGTVTQQDEIPVGELDTKGNYCFAYLYIDHNDATKTVKIEKRLYLDTPSTGDEDCYDYIQEVVNENATLFAAVRQNKRVNVAVGNNRLYLDEGKTQSVTFSATAAQALVNTEYRDVLANYNLGVYARATVWTGVYSVTRNTYVRLVPLTGTGKTIYYTGNGQATWAELWGYQAVTCNSRQTTVRLTNGVCYNFMIGYYDSSNNYVNGSFRRRYVGVTGDLSLEAIYTNRDNPLMFEGIDMNNLSQYNVILLPGEYVEVRYMKYGLEKTVHIFVRAQELITGAALITKIEAGQYEGWSAVDKLAGVYLFGSYDNKKWVLLGAREQGGDFRDLGLVAYRVDCKYFRLLFVGQLKSGSSIEYIEQVVSDRVFRAKIR